MLRFRLSRLLNRGVRPKNRFDSKFVHFVNEHHKVMTENLTKRFVDHRGVALAAKIVSEFPLHHGKRGFDVRPFVVMLHKFLAPELKVVKHLLPSTAAQTFHMIGQRDERYSTSLGNRVHVGFAGVPFVRRNLSNLEVLGRSVEQSGKHLGISRIPPKNFHSRHHVRFNSDHDVTFNPIVLLPNLAVLVVEPAMEAASGETRRIGSEVGFNGLQGQTRLDDAALEQRSQFRPLKVVADAVEMGNLGDVSAPVGFPQVGHEATLRNRGIDLECDIENRIGDRQARPTGFLCVGNRGKSRAQVMQQRLEPILFGRLRGIVGSPRLGVGNFLRLREGHALHYRGSSVHILFPHHHERSRVNVLARQLALGIVGALAGRKLLRDLDAIDSGPFCEGTLYQPSSLRMVLVAASSMPRSSLRSFMMFT